MDVTKPYEFTGFGAMDVTKPYEFTGFGGHGCHVGTQKRPAPTRGTLGSEAASRDANAESCTVFVGRRKWCNLQSFKL